MQKLGHKAKTNQSQERQSEVKTTEYIQNLLAILLNCAPLGRFK